MNEQTPSSEPSTQQLLDNARASMLSFYHASKDCCIAIEKLRDALAKEQFPHLAQLLDLGKLAEISKTGGLAMVEGALPLYLVIHNILKAKAEGDQAKS
jgi:hypothetical protein